MRYLIAFIIALLLLWATAFAQSVERYVKFIGPSGYQPPAIVILQQTPEGVQICKERQAGVTSCRSIAEFNEWVAERKGAR